MLIEKLFFRHRSRRRCRAHRACLLPACASAEKDAFAHFHIIYAVTPFFFAFFFRIQSHCCCASPFSAPPPPRLTTLFFMPCCFHAMLVAAMPPFFMLFGRYDDREIFTICRPLPPLSRCRHFLFFLSSFHMLSPPLFSNIIFLFSLFIFVIEMR